MFLFALFQPFFFYQFLRLLFLSRSTNFMFTQYYLGFVCPFFMYILFRQFHQIIYRYSFSSFLRFMLHFIHLLYADLFLFVMHHIFFRSFFFKHSSTFSPKINPTFYLHSLGCISFNDLIRSHSFPLPLLLSLIRRTFFQLHFSY